MVLFFMETVVVVGVSIDNSIDAIWFVFSLASQIAWNEILMIQRR